MSRQRDRRPVPVIRPVVEYLDPEYEPRADIRPDRLLAQIRLDRLVRTARDRGC